MRPRLFSDEQLFRAARECILERGAEVSTSVIAARLGVSHAALFKRIGSKEQLLTGALCIASSPEWLALLESGPDGRDPRTQLLEVARRVDGFLAEQGPLFAILRASGARPARLACGADSPPHRAHRLLAAWAARLAERHGAQVQDAEAFALMLMSAISARHTMRFAIGVESPDGGAQYVEYVVDALWQGIAPRAESTRQSKHRRTAARPARAGRRGSKTTGGRGKGQRT